MTRLLFFMGTFLEKVHLPGVVLFLGLGRLWFSQTFYLLLLGAVTLLQARRRECPLNPVVIKLKRKYQPDYSYQKEETFIWRFFRRFGNLGALFLFLFWFFVSQLIYWLFS